MIKLVFGLLLALLSSACFAGGYLSQHVALNDAPRLVWRRPVKTIRELARNRTWVFGYLGGLLGWGIYIAALDLAPLSAVQTISASCIGVIAVLSLQSRASTHDDEKTHGREIQLSLLAISGLGIVLGCMRWSYAPEHPSLFAILLFVGVSLTVALLVVMISGKDLRGATYGIVSGICYGAGDVATKGAVDGRHLLIPVFLICAALGFMTLQMAYQHSSLFVSAGLSALLTNSLPLFASVVIFHETRSFGINECLQIIGFVIVVIAAVGFAGLQSFARTTIYETERVNV